MSWNRSLAIVATIGCLAAPGATWALSDDRKQPIEIEANSLDIDEKQGLTTYQGDVVLTQGSIRLEADKLTVHQDKRKTNRVVADGKPVKFQQLDDDKKTYVRAQAHRAEYEVDSEILLLTGKAVLSKGENVVRSERIVYDREKSIVKGGDAVKKGSGRVKMVIPQGKP